MDAKQALVVYSPNSGRAIDLDRRLGIIVRRLCEENRYVVNVRPMTPGMPARELLSPALGKLDLIIAVGGDGTVREVLGAVAETLSQVPVAIIPFGTGNLLAKSLGIWPEDGQEDPMERALNIIFQGKSTFIDMGRINGRYFINSAGIGPIANAIVAPKSRTKRTWKMFAYAIPLIKSVTKQPLIVRITTDSGEELRTAASGIFITNGAEMGIGRGVDSDQFRDGALDLVVMNPTTIADYFHMIRRWGSWFWFGIESGRPAYILRRIKWARIETDRKATVNVDGDKCGGTPADVEILPRAARVVLPERSSAEQRAAQREEQKGMEARDSAIGSQSQQ